MKIFSCFTGRVVLEYNEAQNIPAFVRGGCNKLFGGLTMNIAVNIVHIIICIGIIAVVLLQSGRSAGLSGAIAGGAETFLERTRAGQ